MDVGKPQREIYVEPLGLPEPLRADPQPERRDQPVGEPEKQPTEVEHGLV